MLFQLPLHLTGPGSSVSLDSECFHEQQLHVWTSEHTAQLSHQVLHVQKLRSLTWVPVTEIDKTSRKCRCRGKHDTHLNILHNYCTRRQSVLKDFSGEDETDNALIVYTGKLFLLFANKKISYQVVQESSLIFLG